MKTVNGWHQQYPSLQSQFESTPSEVASELERLRNLIPESSPTTETLTAQAAFAHLTTLFLTQPGRTSLQLPHSHRWLLQTLYQEPDIRAALTKSRLWELVMVAR